MVYFFTGNKDNVAALWDVVSGSNGVCGSILCNAAAGWDGPTGFGTPNAAKLYAADTTTGGDAGGGGADDQPNGNSARAAAPAERRWRSAP